MVFLQLIEQPIAYQHRQHLSLPFQGHQGHLLRLLSAHVYRHSDDYCGPGGQSELGSEPG